MRNNENNPQGSTKRFAYPGNNRHKDDHHDEFSFSPRKQESPRAGGLDMDDVWSIKKNVSLNGSSISQPVGLEGLNYKANQTYYSRYGGGVKGGKDSMSRGESVSSAGNREESSASNNRSWNYSSKGFSYSSFGSKPDKTGQSPTNQNKGVNQSYLGGGKFNDSDLW